MKKPFPSRGFTIVELLIVIVVIGILAAITIIAYNGIQSRAQAAAVSSALDQTNRKLALYLVDNGAYPASLAIAGINNSGGTTYQYSFNNAVSPQTYCVTATDGTTSYNASSAANTPIAGGCPGHGVGGVAPVTNLVTNPSFESGVAGWSAYTGVNAPTQVTTNPSAGSARLAAVGNNTSAAPRVFYIIPVSTGDSVYVSARIRSDGQAPLTALFVIKTMLSGSETGSVVTQYATWTPDGNGWVQVYANYTVAANVDSLMIQPGLSTAANYTGTLGVDAVIAIKSASQANFADGNSSGWIWNGTVNNSTSTGPPV